MVITQELPEVMAGSTITVPISITDESTDTLVDLTTFTSIQVLVKINGTNEEICFFQTSDGNVTLVDDTHAQVVIPSSITKLYPGKILIIESKFSNDDGDKIVAAGLCKLMGNSIKDK